MLQEQVVHVIGGHLARKCSRYNRSLVTQPPLRNLRARLRRAVGATILSAVAASLISFAADYAVFRIRVVRNRGAYGSVTVRHYYAVALKNGKTQFIFDPPQPWTCVNALFPHAGLVPCWYLTQYPEQRTSI